MQIKGLLEQGRTRTMVWWLVISLATCYCAFILPFSFPLHEPVFSATYTAGENNRVAAAAIAGLSLLVAVVMSFFRSPNIGADSRPVSVKRFERRNFWWGLGISLVVLIFLSTRIGQLGNYFADSGYFLVQLKSGLLLHKRIYKDFEFAYGPTLYYWPAAFIRVLAPVGVSFMMGYMVSLWAMVSLGIMLLYYIVRALPISPRIQLIAFSLVTFAAFDNLMGLNYGVVRAVLPFAAVILLSRQKTFTRALAVAFGGELLNLSVSVELGIAFGGGILAYTVYLIYMNGWKWLGLMAGVIAGGLVFASLVPHEYFLTLQTMSKGGYSIILEPLPFVLTLLFATVGLAPLAVARVVSSSGSELNQRKGMLIAFFVAALCLLPAAFSRCDPLHAFIDGIGMYLLSFVAIDRLSRNRQWVWITVVALTFAATQFQEIHSYRADMLRSIRGIPSTYDDPDVSAISKVVGNDKVTFLFATPLRMIDSLIKADQYQPVYYVHNINSFDEAAQLRRIADMRGAAFTLVAFDEDLVYEDAIDNKGIKRWLRFGWKYPQRRTPFFMNALLSQELHNHWKLDGRFGKYLLYQRVD